MSRISTQPKNVLVDVRQQAIIWDHLVLMEPLKKCITLINRWKQECSRLLLALFLYSDAYVHFYEDLLNACRYLEEFIALELEIE